MAARHNVIANALEVPRRLYSKYFKRDPFQKLLRKLADCYQKHPGADKFQPIQDVRHALAGDLSELKTEFERREKELKLNAMMAEWQILEKAGIGFDL